MILPLQKLNALGQSVWYDNIERRLLDNGDLASMIERGDIRGITSNPSIFNNAISKTNDYDAALIPMAWSGWDAEQIFWQLAIEDIRDACDLFIKLYKETDGADGYVSLEVNPALAHNTLGTLSQVKQLWELVARPNLMVKIPATLEGLPAIKEAINAGININVTLIFSIDRYREVMEAYISGLEARLVAGLPLDRIASVASFFVSRMDTKVDNLLPKISPLHGKTAIAYTKLAYEDFRKVFGGERFARLQVAGGHLQRPLWASTSTKNPAYPDTLYVDSLIGPATVNTIPPQTLEAFRDHGKAEPTLMGCIDEAHKVLFEIDSLGIIMTTVTAELEDEGVKAFADAFSAMLKTIDKRRYEAVGALGPLGASVRRCIANLTAKSSIESLWSHDPSLWTKEKLPQEEVRQRLGWLELPNSSRSSLEEIRVFASQIRSDGFDHVLLVGMGGSSLAPEVLSTVFPSSLHDGITFSILDSTDPSQILATDQAFPPEKTLYIISSKSGGTVEINALFSYFWDRTGQDGRHFVAITDQGSTLETLAYTREFQKIYFADPTVGGRYSALTHFGLVPAAILGVDLVKLLNRAGWMMEQCTADVPGERNPGLVLGAILATSALEGRDKLTILADDSVAPFGGWLEQLVAESSGKQGKGLLPVNGEKIMDTEYYGADRLFVYLRREGKMDLAAKRLQEAGYPVLVFNMADAFDLGSEFYRWEVAIAIACSILEVNAFDQPDVQDAKDRTRIKLDAYSRIMYLEEGRPLWEKDGIREFSSIHLTGEDLKENINSFIRTAKKGNYFAINAFIEKNLETETALEELRYAILRKTRCATTVGYGPRFLHSTGQFHKGGTNSGLFLELTAAAGKDIEIPSLGMSFEILKMAQALGDYEALEIKGRSILRIELPSSKYINILTEMIK
jgi:transaldolase/glucose-6-phosphate isomerase